MHVLFSLGVQLLYNVVFLSAMQWISSAICIHRSPPFGASPPLLSQFHPSQSSQSSELSSLHYIPLAICFTHGGVYLSILISQSIPLPLPTPASIYMFILRVCISIPSQKIGSSVPFFYSPHICVNIWYLVFSFWLISLYIIKPHHKKVFPPRVF